MRNFKFGNILSVTDGIIVHGCNAQGVMGSGVAAALRDKYPQVFTEYRKQYEIFNGLKLGTIIPVHISHRLIVVNAITQQDFGRTGQRYVSYQAVHDAFQKVAELSAFSNKQVNYPMIGAGLGGGDWAVLSDIIDRQLSQRDVHNLWIYE